MKKILLACTALLFAHSALALEIGDEYRKTKPGEFYFGLSAAVLQVDDFNDSDAHAIGGTLGINLLNKDYGTVAVDTFFGRTVDAATDQAGVEADVNIAGIFLAYRTPTKIFAKVEMGGVFTELTRSGANLDDDSSAFSWGAGIGGEIFYGVDVELNYSRIHEEVDSIGLSLIFHD